MLQHEMLVILHLESAVVQLQQLLHIICSVMSASESAHGKILWQSIRMRDIRLCSHSLPLVPGAGSAWDYTQGSPESIPVVKNDFIFSAICEELGGIFAICLILVCMSFFLMIVNIALRIINPFYKLIALGLGVEYAFQVFLTIGGATKFIPMTGVTLPLVSYGGSSLLCTILMLAIIQGLYILREDEDEEFEKRKQEAIQRLRAGETINRTRQI